MSVCGGLEECGRGLMSVGVGVCGRLEECVCVGGHTS